MKKYILILVILITSICHGQLIGVVASSGKTTYLLDTYTIAEAAYSLRKLRTGETDAVEIRRDNDNATTIVYLENSGSITLSSTVSAGGTLSTWIGSNSAYIKTWYDQSINNNDAIQTTLTKQPRLINAGTIDVVNSEPAIVYSGAQELIMTSYVYNNPMTVFSVWQTSVLTEETVFCLSSGVTNTLAVSLNRTSGALTVKDYYVAEQNKSILYSQNTQYLFTTFANQTTSNYVTLNGTDGALSYLGRSSSIAKTIGSRDGIYYFTGQIQELIIYQSDETANQTAIELNINNYYLIY